MWLHLSSSYLWNFLLRRLTQQKSRPVKCPFIATALAVQWSVKYFFAPNSPFFRKSGEEKKKKKDNYEAFCFLSKRNKHVENIWCGLFISTYCELPCIAWHLDREGKLLKLLRILIKTMHSKERNWISKTVHCISCSMVREIVFCSKFPDIPDKHGRKTGRRRRRTQAIANRFTQTQQKNAFSK